MYLRELALAVIFVVASSCSEPDGPQPLIGAHGSGEFKEDDAPADVQPAVAFVSKKPGAALHIVEADGAGKLPKHFRIALWEPPPEDAFAEFVDPDGQATTLAVGFIAAVTADHPEYAPKITFYSAIKQVFREGCEGDECTCGPEGCRRSERFCINGHEECYQHELRCPNPDAPDSACVNIESEGDPDIARQPWVSVWGLSQNFLFLYLKQEAAPESFLAAAFGARKRLGVGYHLIALRPMTAADKRAAKACRARAEEQATERYNSEFGESKSVDELKNQTCPLRSSVPGLCADGSPSPDVFDEFLTKALFDLKCPVSDPVMTPLSNWAETDISVRFDREIKSPFE